MTKRQCEYQRVCPILKIPEKELYRRAKIEDCRQYQKFERDSDSLKLGICPSREWTNGKLILKAVSGHYEDEKLFRWGKYTRTREIFISDESFECEIFLNNLSCCYENTLEKKT